MPNWLGDAVMATPVLQDVRNHWPNSHLTAMCQSNASALLDNNPFINEVYSYKKPSGWIHRSQPIEIIDTLKKGQYDLGILLTHSLSSAYWFWRGDIKYTIGYGGRFRQFLLNQAPPFPTGMEHTHQVLIYKKLLEKIGIPISDTNPSLYISKNELTSAANLLGLHGVSLSNHVVVGINPGAAYGSAKCWLPDRFKEVTKKLLENPNVYIVYFGDPSQATLVNDITQNGGGRVINLAGKTNLRELIALIDCCSIILTNDSGPMHIAAALQKPLLALFGSTNEIKTGPFPQGLVIHKHVDCSPCYKRVCPIDSRCMKNISVDEVYNSLKKMMEETHG